MHKQGTVFKELEITLPSGEVVKMEVVVDEPKKDKPSDMPNLVYTFAFAAPIAISFIDYLIK